MSVGDQPRFTGTPCPICGWGVCAGSCAPAWRAKAQHHEAHAADLLKRFHDSLDRERVLIEHIAKLEDAAAEQSRNESMRVQRLVDRVKELEVQASRDANTLELCYGVQGKLGERIAALEALLDRVPHSTTIGYTFTVDTQCYPSCPRCAWELVKGVAR